MDKIERMIREMPKAELHVHLGGTVKPETLLTLAKRNNVSLPVDNIDGLRKWYDYRDFDHFLDIFMAVADCLRTAEDIELITREFLLGQAEQNIVYSEVTFTAYNQYLKNGLGFHEQMDAVNRARDWAEKELGVKMSVIMDIPRQIDPAEGDLVADWAIERFGDGLVGFGLGGPEISHPPEKFRSAFDKVREAGIPCILHAGEVAGPESIWSAIKVADSKRIGHGVSAVKDPELMKYLREKQIPLEVCPTSNVCLKVFPSLKEHCLPQLMEEGLYVTINSDDPPMFNTTLTDEFLFCQKQWDWNSDTLKKLVLNSVNATLLNDSDKNDLRTKFEKELNKYKM